MAKGIPSRSENYSEWYNELVKRSGLAEHSQTRGCMVIKPYGFAIWEMIRDELDKKLKATGHQNAYFPLLIPKSFLSREAAHVEGFAKECAVVTHHRLKDDGKGGVEVDPEAKLEEELIIRPTSETTIWTTYANWIQSYRDLPLKLNQWANIVRWEMRTRLFLRTAEFLWQEGHTAHATKQEAIEETELMLEVYYELCRDLLALPVIKGRKTETERFAGAEDTYCIEAMMQNGWALQAGTSHFLGQNFAKAFEVKFSDENNQQEYVWGSSWGVTTRLMGALVMAHSDDDGLVLPPSIAPIQVVIVPILVGKDQEKLDMLIERVKEVEHMFQMKGIRVKLDDDNKQKPGWKFAEYELKGVPIRIAMGPRDVENHSAEVSRRDTSSKEIVPIGELVKYVEAQLEDMQRSIYLKADLNLQGHITKVNTWEHFKEVLETKGGFISAHWDGTAETEEKIKTETKATIRCIPLDNPQEAGTCIFTGKPSKERVLFARAY